MEHPPLFVGVVELVDVAGEPGWLEGVVQLLRELTARDGALQLVTPSDALRQLTRVERARPATSFGEAHEEGESWIGRENAGAITKASDGTRFVAAALEEARRSTGLRRRVFEVVLREILLAQSVEWFEMMGEFQAGGYGSMRLVGHLERVAEGLESFDSGLVSELRLHELERGAPLFMGMDLVSSVYSALVREYGDTRKVGG